MLRSPACHAARLGVLALLACCVAFPATARADTVYTVSLTNGGLFRFDSDDPYGTITILSGTGSFNQPSALALGPDGNLYIGDLGFGGRISRYNLTTGSTSEVVLLNSGTEGYAGPVWPASIAFRPAALGGEMLVGRSPFGSIIPYPGGPVLQIADWDGSSPVVSNYTTGTTMDYTAGLAVAESGTLYASNSLYSAPFFSGNVLVFGTTGAFVSELVPDGTFSGGVAGPAGLLLSGSTLYTASVMNGGIYATNLTTGSTSPFGPALGGYEAGPLARLSSGDLITGGVGFSGNIYRVWSTGSATLYDSTLASGSAGFNLGDAYDLGQIGGLIAVPEPTTLGLAAGALVAVAAWLRRPRRVG